MYICVDFDGTIVDHRYPEIGEPVPHALAWMKKLNRYGAKIILFTMRGHLPGDRDYLQEAVDYVESNGVQLFGINHNPDQDQWTDSPKAYADVYVDDSGFGCPLLEVKGFARPCVDWKKIGPHLEHMCLSRM